MRDQRIVLGSFFVRQNDNEAVEFENQWALAYRILHKKYFIGERTNLLLGNFSPGALKRDIVMKIKY